MSVVNIANQNTVKQYLEPNFQRQYRKNADNIFNNDKNNNNINYINHDINNNDINDNNEYRGSAIKI